MREPSDKQIAAAALWLSIHDPRLHKMRCGMNGRANMHGKAFEEARTMARGVLKAAMTIAPVTYPEFAEGGEPCQSPA